MENWIGAGQGIEFPFCEAVLVCKGGSLKLHAFWDEYSSRQKGLVSRCYECL